MEKYVYRGKLDRVVDGDTVDALIDVGFDIWIKKRIRFSGLDAWESRTRNLDEKKKGLAAKERVKDLLNNVSSKPGFFRIKSHGVGKYGRILGQFRVYDIEKDAWVILNDLMIEKHHAVAYHGQSKEDIAEGHLANRNLVQIG